MRALPIVQETGSGSFEICFDGLAFLESIESKVSVVSIIDRNLDKNHLYDILLNCAINFPDDKGLKTLYVWSSEEVVSTEFNETSRVLYLFCRNIDYTDVSEVTMQFLSLAILLSSTIIISEKGVMDAQSLLNLSFITEIAKYIRITEGNTDSEQDMPYFGKVFPHFLWLAYDIDVSQINMTPSDAMETLLLPAKGFDRQTFEKNRIRNLLTAFFPNRSCYFLGLLPSTFDNNNHNNNRYLSSEFDTSIQFLKESLLRNVSIKYMKGYPLSGLLLSKLIRAYYSIQYSKKQFIVNQAWDEVCKLESASAVDTAIIAYRKIMDKIFVSSSDDMMTSSSSSPLLPKDERELRSHDELARNIALKSYRMKCINMESSTGPLLDQLLDMLAKTFHSYQDLNMKLSAECAELQLLNLYDTLIKKKLIPEINNEIIQRYDNNNNSNQSIDKQNTSSSSSSTLTTIYVEDPAALRNDWRAMTFLFHQLVKGPGKYVTLSEFCRETLLDTLLIITSNMTEKYLKKEEMLLEMIRNLEMMNKDFNDILLRKDSEIESIRNTLQNDLNQLKSGNITLENALKAQTTLCTMKDERVDSLRIEISSLQSSLTNEMNEKNLLKNDIKSLQNSLLECEEEHTITIQEKDNIINQLQLQLEIQKKNMELERSHIEEEQMINMKDTIRHQAERIMKLEELLLKTQSLADIQLIENKKAMDEVIANKESLFQELTQFKHKARVELEEKDKLMKLNLEEARMKLEEQTSSSTAAYNELRLLYESVTSSQSSTSAECIHLRTLNEALTSDLAHRENKILELSNQNAELKDKLHKLTSEFDHLRETLSTLQMDGNTKAAELHVQSDRIQKYELQIDEQYGRLLALESKLSDNNKAIISLTEENGILKQSNDNLLNQNNNNIRIISTINDELNLLKEKNEAFRTRVFELTTQLNLEQENHNDAIRKYNDIKLTLENDKEQYNLTKSYLEKEISSLQRQLSQTKEMLDSKVVELELSIAESTHLKSTYGSMYGGFEKLKTDLDDRHKSDQTTITTLADALQHKEVEVRNIQLQLDDLQGQYTELLTLKLKYEKDYNENTILMKSYEKEMNEFKEKVTALSDTNKAQDQTIYSLQAEKSNFYQEMQYIIAKAKVTEENLQDAVQQSQEIIATHLHRIAELEIIIKNYEDQIKLKSSNILELEKIRKELEIKIHNHEQHNQLLSREINEFVEEVKELKKKLQDYETDIQSLKIQIPHNQQILIEEKNTNKDLLTKISYLENQIIEYECTLGSNVAEIDMLKNKLMEQQSNHNEDRLVLNRLLETNISEKTKLSEEILLLKNKCDDMIDKNNIINEELIKRENWITEYNINLEQKDKMIFELQESLQSLTLSSRVLTEQIKEMELKLIGVQDTININENEIISLTSRLTTTSESAKEMELSLQSKINELTELLSKSDEMVMKLQSEVSELKKELSQEDRVALKQEVDEKTQEITVRDFIYTFLIL